MSRKVTIIPAGQQSTVVHQGAKGGPRKMACPKCKSQFVSEVKKPNGASEYRCGCGCVFGSSAL